MVNNTERAWRWFREHIWHSHQASPDVLARLLDEREAELGGELDAAKLRAEQAESALEMSRGSVETALARAEQAEQQRDTYATAFRRVLEAMGVWPSAEVGENIPRAADAAIHRWQRIEQERDDATANSTDLSARLSRAHRAIDEARTERDEARRERDARAASKAELIQRYEAELARVREETRKRCSAELLAWCADPDVQDKVDERAVATVRSVAISVAHRWPNFPELEERLAANAKENA